MTKPSGHHSTLLEHLTSPKQPALRPEQFASSSDWPSQWGIVAILIACLLGLMCLAGGPRLGDHEVIVAQIARQALASGEWRTMQYLDTPFLVKPPLTPWLIALVSSFLPGDARLSLPVNDFSARLPSLVATALTVLLIVRLGSSMFGQRAGRIAGFVYLASFGAMLYSVNATAEAALTLFCTWSFAEFWWARQAQSHRSRRWHFIRFYVGLGLAMLAKGPMPVAVVGLPLAAWWLMERPMRMISIGGAGASARAFRLGARQFLPRLRDVFTRLGAWWGLPLFLMMFVPWMIWVARHTPYAWELWEYEYLDRMEGDYPGAKPGRWWYYLPILMALVAPWSLSLPQALATPFQRAWRRRKQPLMYLWFWVVITFVITTLMSFKKPYYILPAAPGCALMLSVILERMFFEARPMTLRAGRQLFIAVLAIGTIGLAIGWFVGRHELPDVWHGLVAWMTPVLGMIVLAGMLLAAAWFGAGRHVRSFFALGCTSMTVFAVTWLTLGPTLGNEDAAMALVARLADRGVPRDAPLYWAGNRPDGRVLFYGNRPLRHVTDPYKLIAEQREEMSLEDIRDSVVMKICGMLQDGGSVFFVFQRGQFDTFMALLNPPARELFSIDRARPGRDKDDWVVVTTREPSSAGKPGASQNHTPLAARCGEELVRGPRDQ